MFLVTLPVGADVLSVFLLFAWSFLSFLAFVWLVLFLAPFGLVGVSLALSGLVSLAPSGLVFLLASGLGVLSSASSVDNGMNSPICCVEPLSSFLPVRSGRFSR